MTDHTHAWMGTGLPKMQVGRTPWKEVRKAKLPNYDGPPGRYSRMEYHEGCQGCDATRTVVKYLDWDRFELVRPVVLDRAAATV
tara:strand:- start:11080 stop:11331 length:252 start_codon:yes stop_codon:yes gene_type:complete